MRPGAVKRPASTSRAVGAVGGRQSRFSGEGAVMKSIAGIVVAAAAGALATHFLDPQQGRRRRAVVRDKVVSRLGKIDEAGRVIAQDLRNRTQGTIVDLWHRVGAEEVGDEVLMERVRA